MIKTTIKRLGEISDVMVTNDSYRILADWANKNMDKKIYNLLEQGYIEEVEWDLPATFTFEDVTVKLTIIYYLGTWYQTFYSDEWDLWNHEEYRIPLTFKFYGEDKVFVETE